MTTNNIYINKSIIVTPTKIAAPNRNLWLTLQSFDDLFKINQLEINKNNIRNMFIEFSKSQGFPVDEISSNQYAVLWLAWAEYLNSKASNITKTLNDANGTEHDYTAMYDQLVWLINAKFILQYLENNNSFRELSPPYTDGTNYIDAALLKVYESLAVLKAQIKDVIEYIKKEDQRFYSSSIK
jgi:hypothetical protein